MALPTNTLGTLTPDIIALKVLGYVKKKFPMISLFATDFSNEPIKFNTQVIAHVPVVGNGPSDYDPGADGVAGLGYGTAASASTLDVPVIVNKHKFVRIQFNEQELSGTARNLVEEQLSLKAYELGRGLLIDLFSAISIANFPTAVTETVLNSDRTTLGKLRKQLTVQGAAFPRYGVVNPDVFENITEDSRIINQQFGIEAPDYEGGVLTGINGFRSIYEWADLPVGENLTGYFGNPEGLVIATRVPSDPGAAIGMALPIPGIIKIVQDPDTGLGIMVRYSYNMDTGILACVLTWMYGFAKGVPAHAVRLASA